LDKKEPLRVGEAFSFIEFGRKFYQSLKIKKLPEGSFKKLHR
jgi:hypothetical protein